MLLHAVHCCPSFRVSKATLVRLAAMALWACLTVAARLCRWAITVDPDNKDLQQRYQRIQALRQSDTPTVPSMLREEQATNPFLRPSDNAIRAALKVPQGASDEDAFAAIRGSKDSF